MVLLFVYGSLQKGLWNNFWLDGGNFLCLAKTVNKYSLRTNNHVIPKVHPDEERYQICGELYEMPDDELKKVDDHEGASTFYSRDPIKVVTNDGEVLTAYIYFCKVIENDDTLVKHGNYKNYILGIPGAKGFVKRDIVREYNQY